MKRFKYLTAALVCALLLTGCGPTGTGEHSEPPPPQVVYDNSLIADTVQTDELEISGQTLRYSYHIPQLDTDSPDGQAINGEIRDLTRAAARAYLETNPMPDSAQLPHSLFPWRGNWMDSTLTLLLGLSQEPEKGPYQVFHYDFASQTRLEQEDLIRSLGLSQEECLLRAKQAVLREFDRLLEGMPMDDRHSRTYYGNVLMMRAQTLAELDRSPLLLIPAPDSCTVISRYYTMEAAEYEPNGWTYLYARFPLRPAEAQEEKSVTLNGITAVLRDNRVFVTAAKPGDSSPQFPPLDGQLRFDTEYEVQGLYGPYTDLVLGSMGKQKLCLALLTRHGSVELVNLPEGLAHGTLCAAPAYGLSGITALEVRPQSHTICALDESGSPSDLAPWFTAMENSGPLPLQDWGIYQGETFGISFPDAPIHSLRWWEQDRERAGFYTLLGMTGEGLVYSYQIQSAGSPLSGAMVLRPAWNEDSGSYDDLEIELRSISGKDIFRSGDAWSRFTPQIPLRP